MIAETASCLNCGRHIPTNTIKQHQRKCLGQDEGESSVFLEQYSNSNTPNLSRENSQDNQHDYTEENEFQDQDNPFLETPSFKKQDSNSFSIGMREQNSHNYPMFNQDNAKIATNPERSQYPPVYQNAARMNPNLRTQSGFGRREEYPAMDQEFSRMRLDDNSSEYPKPNPKYVRESIFPPEEMKKVRCPKCTEVFKFHDFNSHRCAYSACQFCYQYYPNSIISQHMHLCTENERHNAQKAQQLNNYGNRNYQAPAQQQFMSQHGQGNQEFVQRIVTNNGRVIERKVIRTPSGTFVQERVIPPPQSVYRGFNNPTNIPNLPQREQNIFNDAFSAHSNGFNPFEMAFGGNNIYGQGNPQRAIQGPNINAQYRTPPTNQQMQRNPLENIFQSFFGGGSVLNDQFGTFTLFGQDPTDPLMENRPMSANLRQGTGNVDAGDIGLMDFVNMMRMNRGRIFDPGFINQLILMVPVQERQRGVKKDKLNQIPVSKFQKIEVKEGEEERCPVCLMGFEQGDDVKTLPCKHMFHPGCIDTWLVRNSACPICKRDVNQQI